MYSIGRDAGDCYDFNSEENLKKWRGLFIPSLQQIQQLTHPTLIAKQDGLQYVESLILRLLGALISSPSNAVSSPSSYTSNSIHNIGDVQERIKRLFPSPLDKWSMRKASDTLAALKMFKKNKSTSLQYIPGDRNPLKTPVDKFHQLLQKEVLGHKTDIQVSQYILSVLEYIATDIIQLSGHYVRNMTHTEITPQDIRVAMCADKVLMDMFYKDVDEVEGPPPSAGFYYQQCFFDSDITDGEYGNIGCRLQMTYSEAVKELIHEEKQFIGDLNLIIKVFRGPLMAIDSVPNLENIFGNIDDIYDFSNKFLCSLEDAVEVTDEEDCPAVGVCFEENAEFLEFDVFEKYAHHVMSSSCRDNLYFLISKSDVENSISNLGRGMLAAFRYVLPRILLVPVYHCFSYFKAIENLKDITPSKEDRESFVQAEGLLTPLKNQLEKITKRNKFGDGYFLRLNGRTNRATALAKMKDIQRSIDNWDGKDIWQSCSEFIMDGPLLKASGLNIAHRSTRISERHVFLFDGLLVLCKPNNKRTAMSVTAAVTGREPSCSEFRFKERFLIRNIQIIDREDLCNRISNISLLPQPTLSTGNNSVGSNSGGENSPGLSSKEQSFSALTNSSLLYNNDSNNNSSAPNFRYAFEIFNQNHVILVAKTAEEKDMWMSQLILLNTRPMLQRALNSCLEVEAINHPLQLPHASVYRFAIEDLDTNIILEENKSNPNVPLIKGATLLKLVERLTYHKYGDPMLVRTFLTTYRTFCTPSELLKLLIERFEIPEPDFRRCIQAMANVKNELASPTNIHPPQDLTAVSTDSATGGDSASNTVPTSPVSLTNPSTPSDLNTFFDEQDEVSHKGYREMLKRFRKEYAQPVQFRVLNVLRHWIDNHYYDFERDIQLLQTLTEFLDKKVAVCRNMRKWCNHIKKVLDRKKAEQPQDNLRPLVLDSTPPPIEWWIARSNKIEEFDLLTLHPIEIARQLTLLEFDLYRAVKPSELLGTEGQTVVWTKKDKQKTSPNLLKMIKHNSNFTYYLEKCIVEAENIDERVAIVSRIIEIMMVLQELNNFNGVIEVVSALASASVHRLDHTMGIFERNSKLKKAFDEAKELSADHYKKYNEKLRSINPPCVPFFGIYLTNILHIEEGNPEYLSLPNAENVSMHESNLLLDETFNCKLINFNKKRRIAEITGLIQQYQNQPYCFAVEPTIRDFLTNLDPLGGMEEKEFDDYLYNKSLEIEPRGAKQLNKFPRRWPDRNLKSPGIKTRSMRFAHMASSLSNIHSSHSGHHSGHNSHGSQANQIDADTVSLQQQQSPSTPLTPSAISVSHSHTVNDPVFAPVIIGNNTGNITPGLSPTVHSASTFNFSFSQPLSNITAIQPPPPLTPSTGHTFNLAMYNFPLKPPPLPPRVHRVNAHQTSPHQQQSPRSRLQHHFPNNNHEEEEASSPTLSSSPPPLPPRSHSVSMGGTMTRSMSMQSYRDAQAPIPPPLPSLPHPTSYLQHFSNHSSSSSHPQFIHQRVNSDIILSNTSANNSGSTLVRRNSVLEPLPPRRFSQGGPPPPLPPMPNSPTSQSGLSSPAQPSPPPPPPPPPSASIPLTPLATSSQSSLTSGSSPVPELPPKTYR